MVKEMYIHRLEVNLPYRDFKFEVGKYCKEFDDLGNVKSIDDLGYEYETNVFSLFKIEFENGQAITIENSPVTVLRKFKDDSDGAN